MITLTHNLDKIFFLLLSATFYSSLFAQSETNFGELLSSDVEFNSYEKDTTASAVYLFEKGENYFEIRGENIRLITKYHAKIKILKREGIEQSIREIPFYHKDNSYERVQNLKAITHNGGVKTFLSRDNVFKVDLSENWSANRFTFPNVKVGSILEYSYELESPFHFNLTGWKFQAYIPKVYSEYNAQIPGNWTYNRTLMGALELEVNEATIEKECFEVPFLNKKADCEVLKYAMVDIPAMEKNQPFMLSGNNYISNLEFQLSQFKGFDGRVRKYTKSWEDVNREFRNNKDLGRQLTKKGFFEKQFPSSLFNEKDSLEVAKSIYSFVQNHFTWDGKFGLWRDNRVKKAFEEKKGNASEINIALINLLNASGFKTDMMLISTRDNGLPKTTHPVMTDFNYLIAKTRIKGKDYLLDATDKLLPFGMIPFRCLNHYGRVMEFHDKSYWYDLVPENRNVKAIRGTLNFDVDNSIVKGNFSSINTGYESISEIKKVRSYSEDEYLANIEKTFGEGFKILEFNIDRKASNDKKIVQQFGFVINDVIEGETIYLNPFLGNFFDKNPFIAGERFYPIDFGYPREYSYSMNIQVPKGYKVSSLPKKVGLKLPESSGLLKYECQENFGSINIFFSLKIKGIQFATDTYEIIKELFSQTIDIQNNSLIVLQKV